MRWLTIRGAAQNNLKNIDVHFPLGRFVCVTGVSGSGKSSLVNNILREQLARDLNGAEKTKPGLHAAIEGKQHLDKIIDIDQTPIGRTPRSNPATYIKLFDHIRDLYTKLPDSKIRGYKPGRFSFNVAATGEANAKKGVAAGGRCEACEGNGANRIEMDFLADVWVTCPICGGHRFNRETLAIRYRGKNIADVLEMDVQTAVEHFANIPKIAAGLNTLHSVGLDYLKLGQASTTLSGGEAQRIKLARELVKRSTGRTLYLLDEPTTGLHFEDVRRLLDVLHGFVDAGNTVVVIEHHLDVIKTADWVIDLGPEGGDAGGHLIAEGTPEDVAACDASHTGRALRDVLNPKPRAAARGRARAKAAARKPVTTATGQQVIRVIGAREHNLANVNIDVPRNALTVCSGVSGSGKSSFAIDTVYTEGHRRYVESLSSYARQFLGQLQKPRVDHIQGLSPAIAIEQKTASKSPRSTVGTITEIYDYMRVLWARLATAYCPRCDAPIGAQSADEIVEKIMALPDGARALLCASVERIGGETFADLFARQRAAGYARVRVDGTVHNLDADVPVDERRRHNVQVVVDRVAIRAAQRGRINDSVEQCLSLGRGVLNVVLVDDAGEATGEIRHSQHFSCDRCGTAYDELTPHHFSFNSRMGWCPSCEGLGVQRGTRPDAIVADGARAPLDGALDGWKSAWRRPMLAAVVEAVARTIGCDASKPWNGYTEEQQRAFLFGTGEQWIDIPARKADAADEDLSWPAFRIQFKGFYPAVNDATRTSWKYRWKLDELVAEVPCVACHGVRLRPEPRAARLSNRTIGDVCRLPLDRAAEFFKTLKLDARGKRIAGEVLREIDNRLKFLLDVGLEYVTLLRPAPTLSGGEAQRIRLASQVGSGLTGVLYVLDEPTIGLHPRDNARLIAALHRLRNLGNTLLMVEHDREVIESADHVLDFGPGAGRFGGHIIGHGAPKALALQKDSVTGRYLAGKDAIPVPTNRRDGTTATPQPAERPLSSKKKSRNAKAPHPSGWSTDENGEAAEFQPPTLTIAGARHHNLKHIDAVIPLNRLVCVTGVSGSGKSSLISDILAPALRKTLQRADDVPGPHNEIRGLEHLDKVIVVDQTPIGNSPLSNAATYTGVFDKIRDLFAKLPDSRVRGYTANRFSFNRAGGRCDACEGLGQVRHEMHFLPDVWVQCETCHGARYNRETLDVRYRGKNIADVLDMTIGHALELFDAIPRIQRLLDTLVDVGLDYLPLGQSAPTMSGGEAQRVKLAGELGRPNTGRTMYILDEPTTGLHPADLRRLLDVLHRLVDLGNSVVVIEHNLDVVKTADWIIDIGPEAGDAGGNIVAEGTPERIVRVAASHTGRALQPILAAGPHEQRERFDPAKHNKKKKPTLAKAADAGALQLDAAAGRQMPWERDGRRWHTQQRPSRMGKDVMWKGEVLEAIVTHIEQAGGDLFAPTDWSQRHCVEINPAKPPGKTPAGALSWFFHALTGGEWVLTLAIRIPRGSFDEAALQKQLNLKTLDERADLPVYGSEPRTYIRQIQRDLDSVRVDVHDLPEVESAGFRRFIKTAVESFRGYVDALAGSKSAATPWKSDGKSWHLSQKVFSPHNRPSWSASTLIDLIGRISRVAPALTPDYAHKGQIHLKTRAGRTLGRIFTNNRKGLKVELNAPPQRFSPAELAQLRDPAITRGDRTDTIVFWTKTAEDAKTQTLPTLIKAYLEFVG